MSRSAGRVRLLLVLALMALASFALPAAANAAPPTCVDPPAIEIEQGEVYSVSPFALSFYCSDPEGGTLTPTVIAQPAHGTLTGPDALGWYRYTAGTTHVGQDTIRLRVSDPAQEFAEMTVRFTIGVGQNDPPNCFLSIDSRAVIPGQAFQVQAGERTRGTISCTDPDSSAFDFSVHAQPAHGSVTALEEVATGGYATFRYTPAAAHRGSDSFTLHVSDGLAVTELVVAVDVIAPQDDAPQCYQAYFSTLPPADDRHLMEAGEPSRAGLSCWDPEGKPLTFTVVDAPEHGQLSDFQDNATVDERRLFSVRYTTAPTYRGLDEFVVRVGDGELSTEFELKLRVVDPVNSPPTCWTSIGSAPPQPDTRYPAEDDGKPTTGSISCSDPENANVTYSVQVPPAHGVLGSLTPPQGYPLSVAWLSYTPDAEYRGPDEVTIRATDSGGAYTDHVVKFTVVAAANDAPVCHPGLSGAFPGPGQRWRAEAGEPNAGHYSCTDDEGEPLTYTVAEQPAHGTVAFSPGSGSFTYTPVATHRGPDEFKLRAGDGTNSLVSVVQVDVVDPVNNPPQCSVWAGTAGPDGRYPAEAGVDKHLSVSCFDQDSTALTFSVSDQPDHGTADVASVFGSSASLVYRPAESYSGPDELTVTIRDGDLEVQQTVKFQVAEGINDAPECFTARTLVQQPWTGWVSADCYDADNDNLTYTVVEQPKHGTLTSTSGGWNYKPQPGYVGEDTFTYRAFDGELQSGTATAFITVAEADRLLLTPEVDTPQVGTTQRVTATLRDGMGTPRAGETLQWRIAGAGSPLTGQAVTNASGQVEIAWSRSAVGKDELAITHDGTTFDATAIAHWRAASDVQPPTVGPPTTTSGAPLPGVQIGETIDPTDPSQRHILVSRSQTDAAGVQPCPGVPDSRALTLAVSVVIDAGASDVVADSVELFQVAPGAAPTAGALTPPGWMKPSKVEGDKYTFELDCIRTGDLYVSYALSENGEYAEFTVPIGGITLIDPQGVVYDKDKYAERIAAGDTPAVARAAAAITGATVTLQRKVGAAWVTLLSGDPGISPKVNPQITGADGKYQWDVSAGEYRVLVAKAGYDTVTSDAVTIPPPALEHHIALTRTDKPVVPQPDTTAPNTTITAAPAATGDDTTPTFAFSANEGGARFECRVDSGAFAPCTSPHTTAALATGAHTFDVRAVDAAGNADASPARAGFTIVTTQGGDNNGGGGGTENGGGGNPHAGGGAPGGGGGAPAGGGTPPTTTNPQVKPQSALEKRLAKACGKLQGKSKSTCEKRERALAKCDALKTKTKSQKTKKAACVKKAKLIGKAKKP
ncbi:tandem-95 repeat protein [Solirubrobacter sp. CPCC 204708]|uniref:Ig-like domain-containing protein n=1 Tax=Solirubrobacter deserti TaxID=2282478 RepID=A0ABT4RD67_9ACTN|nr:Ig-like domain-containing protein [Solirubrobacter deserti]MBE2317755.1 tandem-95 repeat protein [Solirubrobacter deserti]MDA0136468.1 Ig-like domain-containing protein [Solirubrobacter deserti]